RQAAAAPDRLALTYGQEALSFAELDRRANQVGQYLRRQGVGPEAIVAVFMPRSVEMVIAFLAVLKAGAAYLPLEAATPAARLRAILEEAAAAAVVTLAELAAQAPA